jgi:hypothetical protein
MSGERKVSGDHSDGDTPVSIPNTEVKTVSADGTWGATPWESRTSPGFLSKSPLQGGSSQLACNSLVVSADRFGRRIRSTSVLASRRWSGTDTAERSTDGHLDD